MPLLNSMGSLRNMGLNTTSNSSTPYYIYMFAPGTVNSNDLSQNDRLIGNYDSSQGKFITVNSPSDQIVAFTDSSSVVFNGFRSGIYTPWMAPGNNTCWFNTSGTPGIHVVDLATYNTTNLGGTITQTGTDLTKVIVDSTGATIKIGTEFISSVYYISIIKFTTAGIVWQKKISHPAGLTTSFFSPIDICLDSSDNIYFCGQINGPNGVLGRVTSAGALSWLKYDTSLRVSGLTVVGTTLYVAMATTNASYANYAWQSNNASALPYVGAITASTGAMTKLTWIQYNGGANPYVLTGIEADPSDPTSIFVYGFRQSGTTVPAAKIFILKFNSALTSITSQQSISFTPNTVANPTYTNNVTYIGRMVYQPATNSYYVSGMTQDMTSAGGLSGSYYNGFVIRATVGTAYTGSILNRTYNIATLPDSITLNNVSTFTGTSFGTMTTTAYTLTTTSTTMAASGTVPTKVNL